MTRNVFRRKIVTPLLELLRQGITPEKLAFSIALGITLGVTPVLGSTTILCLLAAALLRLNLPAIQLVNFIVYPLQLVLLVPFIRMGEWLFSAPAVLTSVEQASELIGSGVLTAITTLWDATLHGLVAWLMIGTLACLLLYGVLLPVIRRLGNSLPRETA
ncbi:MAG: DUF2062 domain-containing protein [Candidatus Solibacter sp.]